MILVSPELIEPLGAHEVPLVLPGMQVTEPGDWSFYLDGRIEGRPGCDHRSTVYPAYRYRILDAHHDAMKAAKLHHGYQLSEDYYVEGPHGFSQ